MRSAAKELRHGATGQLVYVAPGAEDGLESTLRFLLSSKSAYVSGPSHPRRAGRVARARGLGEAAGWPDRRGHRRLARHRRGDRPDARARRRPCHCHRHRGRRARTSRRSPTRSAAPSLALDVTAADAPAALAAYLQERHGGVDVVVHNAGITRDRTLARMKPERWDAVLEVNLSAQERLNDALLDGNLIGDGGRIVTVSSIGGIAGNRGQTNYGASKAGVIGIVETLAPELAQRGATINAVAPGFIETQMTAAMPLVVREGGRRMNSLAQGGLPIDVAETIAWFASPASRRRQRQRRARLRPVADRRMSETERTLDSAPGAATLYPRAAFGTFARPLLRKVPLVGGSAPELPELTLGLDDVALDAGHVADYARVCGFDLRDTLPPSYLHILGFPLAMSLMTDGAFPFGVIGLVHVANRIEHVRPVSSARAELPRPRRGPARPPEGAPVRRRRGRDGRGRARVGGA